MKKYHKERELIQRRGIGNGVGGEGDDVLSVLLCGEGGTKKGQ